MIGRACSEKAGPWRCHACLTFMRFRSRVEVSTELPQCWTEHKHVFSASFTLSELQHHIKDDELLLAVWGRVFDVSSGKEFYGEGQGYRLFAGHDCTRAFALTRRQVDMLDQGLEDLSDKQLRHLNRTYWETYVAKYPVVGRLLDPPYDPKDYDNFAGPYSAIRRTRPSLGEERPRESRCPVTRAAKAVGSAIANLIPRQLLPR